jgi:hypothetical protein
VQIFQSTPLPLIGLWIIEDWEQFLEMGLVVNTEKHVLAWKICMIRLRTYSHSCLCVSISSWHFISCFCTSLQIRKQILHDISTQHLRATSCEPWHIAGNVRWELRLHIYVPRSQNIITKEYYLKEVDFFVPMLFSFFPKTVTLDRSLDFVIRGKHELNRR